MHGNAQEKVDVNQDNTSIFLIENIRIVGTPFIYLLSLTDAPRI